VSEASTSRHRIALPFLDRLMEPDGRDQADLTLNDTRALQALRTAVRRDLEALLNARRRRQLLPATTPELIVSPLGYGIPDATSGSYALPEKREWLAAEVERAIQRFEPRLLSVQVRLLDGEELDRTLRLQVDALLQANPLPEPISFETLIQAVSHEVVVANRD
jgi:type VI secretion system protein ImpF